MPNNVVKTKDDEILWQKAKAEAAKQGQAENYAYIMGIYKNMGGLDKKADIDSIIDSIVEKVAAPSMDKVRQIASKLKNIATLEEFNQANKKAKIFRGMGSRMDPSANRHFDDFQKNKHLFDENDGRAFEAIMEKMINRRVVDGKMKDLRKVDLYASQTGDAAKDTDTILSNIRAARKAFSSGKEEILKGEVNRLKQLKRSGQLGPEDEKKLSDAMETLESINQSRKNLGDLNDFISRTKKELGELKRMESSLDDIIGKHQYELDRQRNNAFGKVVALYGTPLALGAMAYKHNKGDNKQT